MSAYNLLKSVKNPATLIPNLYKWQGTGVDAGWQRFPMMPEGDKDSERLASETFWSPTQTHTLHAG